TAPVRGDGTGVASGLWQRLVGGDAKPDTEVLKAARDKISAPLFRAVGRVGVRSDDPDRIGHLLWRVIGTLHSMRQPGVTLRRRRLPGSIVAHRIETARTPLLSYPCHLNSRELAGLI